MKLVALHGFTGSGRDFEPFAEALGLPITAIDLLGHGDAPSPAEVTAYQMTAQVDRLAAMLNDEPMVLLGYSMGGRVALRLCSRLGSSLRGLVLIGAHPGLKDPVERADRAAADMALATQIEARGIAWFADHWSGHPLIQSQQQIEPAVLGSMQARRASNCPVGLANTLRGIGQGAVSPVWSTLSSIEAPVLLLTGSADVKYSALAGEMAGSIPNAVHRPVAGAGHCVHLEAMVEAARIVREFLGAISG